MNAAPRIGREMLYLSREDVAALGVTAAEMNDAVAAVFRAQAEKHAWTQPKMAIFRPDGASFRAKGGVVSGPDYGALKWFGYFPGNERAGLPDFVPLVLLNEGDTGMPVAILDGVVISAQRTAALTAVAARYMARKDASSVAFLACGSQARSHLEALKAEFPLRRIVAYSRRATTAKAFAGFAEERGLKAEVAADPNQAIGAVDMVVSSVPHAATGGAFLDARRLAPGTLVSMVDLGYSWVASSFGALDRVFTDDIADSGPGGSEKLGYTGAYAGDLAGLVAGKVSGRLSPRERNAFVFAGSGLADVAAAVTVYERAVAKGIGRVLPL
jgi:ornithine cyclodeaminase/alanine dehydrogenase-like protein (mu-crystallin family)